jgi:hypothetical protein
MTAKILAITSKILMDCIKQRVITMLHEFCTLLTAEIRHLGYVSHRADVLLLFLVRCLTLIFAVMEVLDVPEPALWESVSRSKNTAAGPFAHTIPPAASPPHHRLPA